MISINNSPVMFIANKYSRCYLKIIENAKHRELGAIYTEKHHIWPKSLGGPDTKCNLVKLTAREHFILHVLLTKFTTDEHKRNMCYALSYFQTRNRNLNRALTARHYAQIREALSFARKGVSPSQKCRDAVSAALKGVPLSTAHREQLSTALSKKKKFCALSPLNVLHKGQDLKAWCKEMGLSYSTVDKPEIKIITAGRNKGWVVSGVDFGIDYAVELRDRSLKIASQNRANAVREIHGRGKYRPNLKTDIVLMAPDHRVHVFGTLAETACFGKPSALQNVKNVLPYTFVRGSWAGWTLMKYSTCIK